MTANMLILLIHTTLRIYHMLRLYNLMKRRRSSYCIIKIDLSKGSLLSYIDNYYKITAYNILYSYYKYGIQYVILLGVFIIVIACIELPLIVLYVIGASLYNKQTPVAFCRNLYQKSVESVQRKTIEWVTGEVFVNPDGFEKFYILLLHKTKIPLRFAIEIVQNYIQHARQFQVLKSQFGTVTLKRAVIRTKTQLISPHYCTSLNF